MAGSEVSPPPVVWTISVVSHGHLPAIRELLRDCQRELEAGQYEIVLTLNIPESETDLAQGWTGPLHIIRNRRPQGFAANHNAALRLARGRYVAALDPDLRLHGNPFPRLAEALNGPATGIVSTCVLDEGGAVADHARSVPTPLGLARRYRRQEAPLYDASLTQALEVDWVAGLFMAMRCDTFEHLRGFDPRYFMYCEDVDLCLRAWNAGLSVQVVPTEYVTHPARRQSLRRIEHFAWHCGSFLRLWTGRSFWRFLRRPRGRGLA